MSQTFNKVDTFDLNCKRKACFSGAVFINEPGRLDVNAEANFSKGLNVDNIEPLTPGGQVLIGGMPVGSGNCIQDTNMDTNVCANDNNTITAQIAGQAALRFNTNHLIIGFNNQLGNGGNNNIAIGWNCLTNHTTNDNNVAIGENIMTNGSSNTWSIGIGGFCLANSTGNLYNTCIGYWAGQNLGFTGSNTLIGFRAGDAYTNAGSSTCVGSWCGGTGGSPVDYSVYVGALCRGGSGGTQVFIGGNVGNQSVSGSGNVVVGYYGGEFLTSGQHNTCMGSSVARRLSSGDNNIILGRFAGTNTVGGTFDLFEVTTQDNRIVMGNGAHTNAYIEIPWTVVSDARDKTNVEPLALGTDFINSLNPVSFQFKENRESTETKGGKRYGFLAQEILAEEEKVGEPVIIDNEDPNKLKYTGEHMIPILVKALQEANARITALEQTSQ